MIHKYRIRLLALLLAAVLLALPVSADAGSRMAVEREVFAYLTEELSLSTAAACGVMANIEHESAFQPTVLGDQGTSYGLCQWHNERFTALRSYCAALRLDYRTVEGQMAYLKYELGTNFTNLLLTLQSLDNTPDGAYRAAYMWCIQFERPNNAQAKAASRGEMARGKYWPRYNNFQPIILIAPEPEETQPSAQVLLEQLKQNQVTIPLPPEEEVQQQEDVRHFSFEKPAFLYYTPHNLPKSAVELPREPGWEIPTLIGIGVLMVLVVIFPTKKLRRKVYRRGKFMV